MSQKKSSQPKDERTRNWTFVVYPFDGNPPAPENWRDILDDEHVPWIESPLHDRDLNPSGESKKPHIHVLVMYEGKKSFDQIKVITDALNAPIPQKVANVRGLVRYFIHMDNPEKAQYEKEFILSHGGADAAEYLKATGTSRYLLIGEMMDWICENDIIEMEDLLFYARNERFNDWFPLLCDNSTFVMSSFIKSRRHRSLNNKTVLKVNSETGEVID